MSRESLVKKLERLGDKAENWNYHENAEFLRGLAEALEKGKFASIHGSDYLDGEKILKYVAAHVETGV